MRRTVPALVVLVLLVTGCTGDGAPVVSEDPIPVEPAGGIGDGAGSPDGGRGDRDGGPIPVEPDGGPGGEVPPLDEAPSFGVSSEVASAVVEPSSGCWTAESTGEGVCFDGVLSPEQHVLAVDEQLVVTYPEGEMVFEVGPAFTSDGGFVSPENNLPFELQAGGLWIVSTADLEPGEYVLHLAWTGEQGDATAALTLRVG